ncbi:MAG: hypothetical protein FWD41_02975 [Actinomycetia bacterium]|nr:hypothetical protein [Actinomycetes bacterium]
MANESPSPWMQETTIEESTTVEVSAPAPASAPKDNKKIIMIIAAVCAALLLCCCLSAGAFYLFSDTVSNDFDEIDVGLEQKIQEDEERLLSLLDESEYYQKDESDDELFGDGKNSLPSDQLIARFGEEITLDGITFVATSNQTGNGIEAVQYAEVSITNHTSNPYKIGHWSSDDINADYASSYVDARVGRGSDPAPSEVEPGTTVVLTLTFSDLNHDPVIFNRLFYGMLVNPLDGYTDIMWK